MLQEYATHPTRWPNNYHLFIITKNSQVDNHTFSPSWSNCSSTEEFHQIMMKMIDIKFEGIVYCSGDGKRKY